MPVSMPPSPLFVIEKHIVSSPVTDINLSIPSGLLRVQLYFDFEGYDATTGELHFLSVNADAASGNYSYAADHNAPATAQNDVQIANTIKSGETLSGYADIGARDGYVSGFISSRGNAATDFFNITEFVYKGSGVLDEINFQADKVNAAGRFGTGSRVLVLGAREF